MTSLTTPLTAQAVMTSGTTPSIGKFNIYNATSANISTTLPALSGLNVGARLSVGKYIGDSSSHTVTVACAGSDKFQDGSTASLIIYEPGSQRELQVIEVSSTKYWQIVGGIISPTIQPITATNTATLSNKTLSQPIINNSIFGASGQRNMQFTGSGTEVNYFACQAGPAGSPPTFAAAGSDTDIGITLQAKNAGAFSFYVASGNKVWIKGTGSGTNHDVDITSKGSGVVMANAKEIITSAYTINGQTGTTYTLVLTDAGHLVTLTNGSAITLTVPTNASVAFPTGTHIKLAQLGAGQVTVAAAGGVTVNATPGLKISAQYGAAELIKTATDTWLLTGTLSA